MTRSHTIHMNPPWTLLHERAPTRPVVRRANPVSEAERALARRRLASRMESARERAFRDFTLCSRPYL